MRGLLGGLGAILLVGQAYAADMPVVVKRSFLPPSTPCVQTACTGFYAGGNLINSGGNFDVLGAGLNGLASNGVMFGVQAGYEYWNGRWFAAIEGVADYSVQSKLPTGSGTGNTGKYAVGGLVKVGYTLAGLFGGSPPAASGSAPADAALPSTGLVLPSQLASSLISPYILIGVWDRPWGAGLATGAGVQALIATNWTLDAEYIHVNYNNAVVNPLVSEQSENIVKINLSRHF